MPNFECGFAGRDKDVIRLVADLGRGWKKLDRCFGFDEQDFLDYRDSKFRCRLRLVEKAPDHFETRRSFPERYLLEPVRLDKSSVSLHGVKLEINIPLDQRWSQTQDRNKYPIIFENADDIFIIKTEEGTISYRLQIWIVLHGPLTMFVRDQFEKGDGFAWIGGRSESNRRKF
jgi:hypothetical protein